MITVKEEILINTDLEKVFKVAETYPLFVDFYKDKSLFPQDERKINVEVGLKILGINFKWKAEGLKIKNKKINFIQTQGPLKGLQAAWYFTKLDGKTRVIIENKFKSNYLLGRLGDIFIANLFVKTTIKKILKELKKKSEEVVGDG